jgi:phytoene dehydrogenase-like protein
MSRSAPPSPSRCERRVVADKGRRGGARIEGGVDALVIGADAEGLAAAALIAKAGFKTILIETGAPPGSDLREIAPGFFVDPKDSIAALIDPSLVDRLDLYRHGLAFAERRLSTLARFADGAVLSIGGDPELIGESIAALSEADAARFDAFAAQTRRQAKSFAPWFEGRGPAPASDASAQGVVDSVEDAVNGLFEDERLEDYLRAEASIGAARRPAEAFTFGALVRRWSGEAAGLDAALAYIEKGGRGFVDALRRAGQAAGVNFRLSTLVREIIIEWDHAAGVTFEDGAQVRAGAVVSALPGAETFLRQIGRDRLDIEFARAFDRAPEKIGLARVAFALDAPPPDPFVRADLRRRFLFAPNAHQVNVAWRAAAEGGAAGHLTMELTFPSAFEEGLAPEGALVASAILHPVGVDARNPSTRAAIDAAARQTFDALAPGVGGAIVAVEILGTEEGAPPILSAVEAARSFEAASRLEGLFFCGPEASIGRGPSGLPGRRAAQAAIAYLRDRERS